MELPAGVLNPDIKRRITLDPGSSAESRPGFRPAIAIEGEKKRSVSQGGILQGLDLGLASEVVEVMSDIMAGNIPAFEFDEVAVIHASREWNR